MPGYQSLDKVWGSAIINHCNTILRDVIPLHGAFQARLVGGDDDLLSRLKIGHSTVCTREIGAGENVAGRVRVTNIGSRAGEEEVVQLYFSHSDMRSAPLHALTGFQRVHLQAGESKWVGFVITPRQMSLAIDTMASCPDPGIPGDIPSVIVIPNMKMVLSLARSGV